MMKFFKVTDESNIKHKILVVPLGQDEMDRVIGQCRMCMPSIAVSSLIQMAHPYIIIDFGADSWKTAIPLDELSEDGHRIGDELAIGDMLTVFLTSDSKAVMASGEKVYLNTPLETVFILSIIYTSDIAENYAIFNLVTKHRAENSIESAA